MYVKATKTGFYDTAKNGSFVEIKPGTVFQVPDGTEGLWFVECDERGNVIQRSEIEKNLGKLKLAAETAEKEAKLAADKAKQAHDAYEAEKKRADEVAAEQAKKPKPEPKKGGGDKPKP